MDRELIERLAREAGFTFRPRFGDLHECTLNELGRFVALVATECAKVCDEMHAKFPLGGSIAAADVIRQRFRYVAPNYRDPRIRDLPPEEQAPFREWLRGHTRPHIEGAEVQDGYFQADYDVWKSRHGRS